MQRKRAIRALHPGFAAILACTGTLLFAASAVAAEVSWPLPEAGEVVTPFGAVYATAKGESTHRGVDLAAEPGVQVLAPIAGTVTFVGSVPAIGGGTVIAATVTSAEGVMSTVLPLGSPEVERGASVAAGEPLGALADAGDGSSSEPHLHVGIRRGDVYLDPMTILETPEASRAAPSTKSPTAPADDSASMASPGAARTAAAPSSASPTADSVLGGSQVAASSPTVASVNSPYLETGPAAPYVALGEGVGSNGIVSAGNAATTGEAPSAEVVVTGSAATAPRGSADVNRGPRSDTLPSVTRLAEIGKRVSEQLNLVWRIALLATLVGLGALWPVWRRQQLEEQPGTSTAPGGSDVAAAAGRC